MVGMAKHGKIGDWHGNAWHVEAWQMAWRGMANGMARHGDGMARHGDGMAMHGNFLSSFFLSHGAAWRFFDHFFAWHGMAWQISLHGMAWHGKFYRLVGMAWRRMAWHGKSFAWHGAAWRRMATRHASAWCIPGTSTRRVQAPGEFFFITRKESTCHLESKCLPGK